MPQENRLVGIVTWTMLSLVALSGIVLISYFAPYIPDYDGLMYYDVAKTINGWLFTPSDYRIWIPLANEEVFLWPISNALSVFITAIFYNTFNKNLLPTLINAAYLFIFAIYISKIRSISYAYIASLLLCSHTLFFRLFTTLTTEFAVGLWIFAFLITLISDHQRRGVYLVALTIIGLLLRTIDVVFILMAASTYSVIYYALWKDWRRIVSTLRPVGLALFFSAPFFFQHYKAAFAYIYNTSFGVSAASWKSLAGVENKYDLFLQYIKFIEIYNSIVIYLFAATIFFGLFSKEVSSRSVALVVGVPLGVCLPLFMASSLNIQVVFWVYACLFFVVCEIGRSLCNSAHISLRSSVVRYGLIEKLSLSIFTVSCVFFLSRSWAYEVRYLTQQKDVSEIAFQISAFLDGEAGTHVATNYRGLGALDLLGLAWNRRDKLSDGGIMDIYSRNKQPTDYLELKRDTSFFISAHRNYFFPPHFGVNDHIEQTHRIFSDRANAMGFRRLQQISHSGRDFDIWYRPAAVAHLQYLSFGDKWISWSLPLEIGSEDNCAGELVSGRLNVSLDFPNPNLPAYEPPFLLTIYDIKYEKVISTVTVTKYGLETVVFYLESIECGRYALSIDKAFSTGLDRRELSALFVSLESAFKFDGAAKANGDKSFE